MWKQKGKTRQKVNFTKQKKEKVHETQLFVYLLILENSDVIMTSSIKNTKPIKNTFYFTETCFGFSKNWTLGYLTYKCVQPTQYILLSDTAEPFGYPKTNILTWHMSRCRDLLALIITTKISTEVAKQSLELTWKWLWKHTIMKHKIPTTTIIYITFKFWIITIKRTIVI